MKLLRYIWRVVRWWFKCLWAGRILPRKEDRLFSRSYMRKAWSPRLRELDREVNARKTAIPPLDVSFLLMERRVMVAKRTAFRFD